METSSYLEEIKRLEDSYNKIESFVKVLETQKLQYLKFIRGIEKQQSKHKKDQQFILEQINLLDYIEENKKIIIEDIKTFDDYDLLSKSEIFIIIDCINSTDSYHMQPYLTNLVRKVIEIKRNYPQWVLISVRLNDLSSEIIFELKFKDNNNMIFTL
jgi:hypothetical protein